MQGFIRAVRSCHETLKLAILQHSLVRDTTEMNKIFSRCGRVTSSPPAATHQKGLENTTVADVLMTKGGEKIESWLWCSTDDTVHGAVKQHKLITVTSNTNILHAMQLMTENHIRHVPVIDENIVGMISVVDVVRAVVEQQSGEVKRLNEFIKGGYSKNL
ncbi:hypothetical protein HYC85_020560 [Camellia sinensis]|uniref:CBS domain-containing protein n=1 Tax=Camellia sinensis TaxID=4442 RepID=A0A7J7GU01_CAMSI|nr:hypothetical protein HYC85_020560 [Camellia sinensis]